MFYKKKQSFSNEPLVFNFQKMKNDRFLWNDLILTNNERYLKTIVIERNDLVLEKYFANEYEYQLISIFSFFHEDKVLNVVLNVVLSR